MHFVLVVFLFLFLVPFIVEPNGTKAVWGLIFSFAAKTMLIVVPIVLVAGSILATMLVVATVFGR